LNHHRKTGVRLESNWSLGVFPRLYIFKIHTSPEEKLATPEVLLLTAIFHFHECF
jgi:hypothetical protein